MRLRRNEYCPIHKSISCCGREQTSYARRLQPGIRRIEDPHHPRGYRELRSRAEMRKLLNRKIVEQDRKVRHLPRRIHRLQRYCPGPPRSQRHGRSVEGRSPGQYSGNALVV